MPTLYDRKRRQKHRLKIEQNPKNTRFEDLKRLLEDYGFELKRSKGSHHSFVGFIGDEKVTIVIPFRRPIQEVYVKNVLILLNQIELIDDELAEGEDGE